VLLAAGLATTLFYRTLDTSLIKYGADSITIDPDVGVVTGNLKTVTVGQPTTFTLTAKNASGNATATREIDVTTLGIPGWQLKSKEITINDISVDKIGNLYLSGAYSVQNQSFGVLIKYNANGNELWRKNLNTVSGAVRGVVVDKLGNVIIIGQFDIEYSTSQGIEKDVYLSKYSPDGKQMWTKNFSTNKRDEATYLTIDSLDNLYVSGVNQGEIVEGAINLDASWQPFLIKFDLNGNLIWGRQNTELTFRYFTIDESGNLLVLVRKPKTSSSNFDFENLILKYDDKGNEILRIQDHVTNYKSSGEDVINQLLSDDYGNIFVVGETKGVDISDQFVVSGFLLKYDNNGKLLWKKLTPSGNYLFGRRGIVSDKKGNVIFLNTVRNMTTNLNGLQGTLTKYSPSGLVVWEKVFSFQVQTFPRKLVIDSRSNIFIFGFSSGNLGEGNDNFLIHYK
jgi:hypothetical protein